MIREVKPLVMDLVGDGEVGDSVLLNPERLKAHRAADQRATLDSRCREAHAKQHMGQIELSVILPVTGGNALSA